MDIDEANKLLAKTINIAFTFDAPVEGAWGNTITKDELKTIKSAGFLRQYASRFNGSQGWTALHLTRSIRHFLKG